MSLRTPLQAAGPRLSARRPVAAVALLLAAILTPVGTAQAQPDPGPPPPPLRHVKYTVFSEVPVSQADIYYRDTDPPNWADYSHNPYQFSPNVEADVGPNQMWTLDVMLADPDQWAMVVASDFYAQGPSNFHCVLAVDGVVVKTDQGPKGALCSIRSW
jgi:hypothetical protein